MELVHLECLENHTYKLEFIETIEKHLVTIRVTFEEFWRLTHALSLLDDFGRAVGFCIKGDESEFPYESKKSLISIPLHIPSSYGRQLFKSCFDFFIKESQAPMHIATLDHPAYPLLVATFDRNIIGADVVHRLIDSIVKGIQSCETEREFIESKKQELDDDQLDEVNEDVVVEFEFDEELKKAMKEPVSNLVQPIGGGMENA